MRNVMIIAQGTVIRQVRNKVLYLLVLLSFCFIGLGSLYKILSLGAEQKLMQDLGLAGMTAVGMVVAVFIGSNEVGKELREGTVDELLAKPLGRDDFLLGKYVGTLFVAFINIGLLAIGFSAIMYGQTGGVPVNVFRAVVLSMFEVSVVVSVAIFFATFLPEAAGAVLTFLVFLAGHGAHMLPLISGRTDDVAVSVMTRGLFYVIPNLHHFNTGAAVGADITVPWIYTACTMLYAVCYTGMLLSLAVLIFRNKEL